MGLIFRENFDAEPAPGLPIPGWGNWGPNFTSSTAQFQSSPNSLRHNTASVDQNWTTAADRNGGNAQVSMKIFFNTTAAEINWQLTLRDDGTGNNCYQLLAEPVGSLIQGLTLIKTLAAIQSTLGAVSGTAIALQAWYMMRLRANGSTISAFLQRQSDKMWLTSGGTFQVAEVAAISVTDTAITGTGVYSLIGAAAGTDVAYADDFLAESLDMPVVKPFVGGMEPYHTESLIRAGEIW